MLWDLPALIVAVANAAYYLVIRNHIMDRDPRILTALGFFLSAVLLPAITSARGVPVIGPDYFSAVIISIILNIIGLSLIFQAMESSYLFMPMLSFTPFVVR